jgi:hypothetical protein
VARWKREGFRNEEIADRLRAAGRTRERGLAVSRPPRSPRSAGEEDEA